MEFIPLIIAASVAGQPIGSDADTIAAINATCHDYVDGQLQGDPDRVSRSLHPDLAKRAVIGQQQYESFGLRRMTKEELVDLTKRGALKTPVDEWDRKSSRQGSLASFLMNSPLRGSQIDVERQHDQPRGIDL